MSTPSPRTSLNLEVSFRKSYGRELHVGVLKNISLSGAFLEYPADKFRAQEKIQLTFVVSGRERKIAAQVIWSNTAGCGVKFIPSNNRDVQIVDDLIYFVESSKSGRRSVLDNILKKVS